MSSQNEPDDFDIAKTIVSQVKDLPSERKERIFRWVVESIGLGSVVTRPVTPALAHSAATFPVTPLESLPSGAGSAKDIKTFITFKEPKGDTQFAAAVAYYYRFEAPEAQRRDTINASLLQEATRLAGRSRLTNPLNTLNNVKRSGYLDSSSPGEFAINSVGENLIAMTLPGGAQSPNGRPAVRKKATKKKKR